MRFVDFGVQVLLPALSFAISDCLGELKELLVLCTITGIFIDDFVDPEINHVTILIYIYMTPVSNNWIHNNNK